MVKRTKFSIFGQCNPYHQSTYRFPIPITNQRTDSKMILGICWSCLVIFLEGPFRIGCRNRMQGWESVRWLVIGITSPKNRKVGSFLGEKQFMFLIETKFIFKLLEKFRRQNECQEIPRLRLSMIFKNSSFRIIRRIRNSEFLKFKKWTAKVSEISNILKSQN